jgi:hypothetical protein
LQPAAQPEAKLEPSSQRHPRSLSFEYCPNEQEPELRLQLAAELRRLGIQQPEPQQQLQHGHGRFELADDRAAAAAATQLSAGSSMRSQSASKKTSCIMPDAGYQEYTAAQAAVENMPWQLSFNTGGRAITGSAGSSVLQHTQPASYAADRSAAAAALAAAPERLTPTPDDGDPAAAEAAGTEGHHSNQLPSADNWHLSASMFEDEPDDLCMGSRQGSMGLMWILGQKSSSEELHLDITSNTAAGSGLALQGTPEGQLQELEAYACQLLGSDCLGSAEGGSMLHLGSSMLGTSSSQKQCVAGTHMGKLLYDLNAARGGKVAGCSGCSSAAAAAASGSPQLEAAASAYMAAARAATPANAASTSFEDLLAASATGVAADAPSHQSRRGYALGPSSRSMSTAAEREQLKRQQQQQQQQQPQPPVLCTADVMRKAVKGLFGDACLAVDEEALLPVNDSADLPTLSELGAHSVSSSGFLGTQTASQGMSGHERAVAAAATDSCERHRAPAALCCLLCW